MPVGGGGADERPAEALLAQPGIRPNFSASDQGPPANSHEAAGQRWQFRRMRRVEEDEIRRLLGKSRKERIPSMRRRRVTAIPEKGVIRRQQHEPRGDGGPWRRRGGDQQDLPETGGGIPDKILIGAGAQMNGPAWPDAVLPQQTREGRAPVRSRSATCRWPEEAIKIERLARLSHEYISPDSQESADQMPELLEGHSRSRCFVKPKPDSRGQTTRATLFRIGKPAIMTTTRRVRMLRVLARCSHTFRATPAMMSRNYRLP